MCSFRRNMARQRQLSLLASCLILVLTGALLRGATAITLPSPMTTIRSTLRTTRSTTTTDSQTTSTTAQPSSSGSSSSAPTAAATSEEEDDEPYTTKRNANLHIDMPKFTQFPLSVMNAEIKTSTVSSAPSRTTSPTRPSPPTAPPRRDFSQQPLYRLNGSNGQSCILLQVDALITVKYKTTLGEIQEADIYVPDKVTVTGYCDDAKFVTMSLKWDAFVLSWHFAKTPGGERWYADKIELTYNSSDRHFEHTDQPNKTVRLSSAKLHSSMLFPTPVGKSYTCSDEQEIKLTDGKNEASVFLREMKLQPFKFKNNEFAEEFSCTALSARANRDETAPIAVGSTLAVSVLLTISGYAGWRYFKVNKVKYDTME